MNDNKSVIITAALVGLVVGISTGVGIGFGIWSDDSNDKDKFTEQELDLLIPPSDLECPIDSLTTLNGMVMEDIVPMTRFTVLEPKMAEYYDWMGIKVTTFIGIREARSRMGKYYHFCLLFPCCCCYLLLHTIDTIACLALIHRYKP